VITEVDQVSVGNGRAAGAGLGDLDAGIGLGDSDSAGLEPGGTGPSLAKFSSCGLQN
jgi:hypothetical protein